MRSKLTTAREILVQGGAKDAGVTGLLRASSIYLRRKYHRIGNETAYNPEGIDIFDQDWDNLIILDACRFDYFRQYSDLPGRLESRISRGSTSKEFIKGNFEHRQQHDTVYFTDNPWFGKLRDEIDAELHDYSVSRRDAFDGLVTHPSTVTKLARGYDSEYPNKRLIVHYLQPHAPYFDTDGRERFRWPSENHSDCDPEELAEAYTDNLKLVLSETSELVDSLTGKTVVTSDHGELLGERLLPFGMRQYQHPPGVYIEELVKVPWLVIEGDERKEITSEPAPEASGRDDLDNANIDDRLEALGYR